MTDGAAGLSRHVHRLVVIVFVTLGLGGIGYWFLVDWQGVGVERSFTVSADTERAIVTIHDKDGASVRLPANLKALDTGLSYQQSALLHIPDGATIAFARKERGVIRLQIKASEAGQLPMLTPSDSPAFALHPNTTLELGAQDGGAASDLAFILPFRGSLSLGGEVRETVEYILLNGSVMMVEKPFGGGRVVVQTANLDVGDDVRWASDDTDTATRGPAVPLLATGFVRIGEGPAVHVEAHINAPRLTVHRYGAKPYDIAPTPFESAAKDPISSNFFIPLITILGAVLLVYEGLLKVMSNWNVPVERNAPKKHSHHH